MARCSRVMLVPVLSSRAYSGSSGEEGRLECTICVVGCGVAGFAAASAGLERTICVYLRGVAGVVSGDTDGALGVEPWKTAGVA